MVNYEIILNNSIIINGPVGSGKSLIARTLSEKLNIPYVNADQLRHLLHHEQLALKLNECVNNNEKHNALLAQKKLRDEFPNLQNYSDMGFNAGVSIFINENFGPVAWHFYQKQFEFKLLKSLLTTLPKPYIVDLGGGMGISLDFNYKMLEAQYKKEHDELFKKHFNLNGQNFATIQHLLNPFKHVVELKLPANYKNTMHKAANSTLNDIYIATEQYSKVATISVNVENMISGKHDINQPKLNEVCNQIIASVNNSKFIKNKN